MKVGRKMKLEGLHWKKNTKWKNLPIIFYKQNLLVYEQFCNNVFCGHFENPLTYLILLIYYKYPLTKRRMKKYYGAPGACFKWFLHLLLFLCYIYIKKRFERVTEERFYMLFHSPSTRAILFWLPQASEQGTGLKGTQPGLEPALGYELLALWVMT